MCEKTSVQQHGLVPTSCHCLHRFLPSHDLELMNALRNSGNFLGVEIEDSIAIDFEDISGCSCSS